MRRRYETPTKPHAFMASPCHGQCAICGGWPDASYHNLELFTHDDREREAARQQQQAVDLAAKMRTPKADVSQAAGILERESPLFFGTGDNPTLF